MQWCISLNRASTVSRKGCFVTLKTSLNILPVALPRDAGTLGDSCMGVTLLLVKFFFNLDFLKITPLCCIIHIIQCIISGKMQSNKSCWYIAIAKKPVGAGQWCITMLSTSWGNTLQWMTSIMGEMCCTNSCDATILSSGVSTRSCHRATWTFASNIIDACPHLPVTGRPR